MRRNNSISLKAQVYQLKSSQQQNDHMKLKKFQQNNQMITK